MLWQYREYYMGTQRYGISPLVFDLIWWVGAVFSNFIVNLMCGDTVFLSGGNPIIIINNYNYWYLSL